MKRLNDRQLEEYRQHLRELNGALVVDSDESIVQTLDVVRASGPVRVEIDISDTPTPRRMICRIDDRDVVGIGDDEAEAVLALVDQVDLHVRARIASEEDTRLRESVARAGAAIVAGLLEGNR